MINIFWFLVISVNNYTIHTYNFYEDANLSGDLKSGDCLFCSTPLPQIDPLGVEYPTPLALVLNM